MVQVSITEMYDMNTVKDKIGVFAVHTPSMASIARRWKGLLDNHKFIRVVKCDLSVACASVLPADPLQVGIDADQIAPQDLMNPILYRAVSNDAWNLVLNRVYAPSTSSGYSDVLDVRYNTDGFMSLGADQQERLYYSLLAEGGWRKAMPQAGLSMKGLVPIVYPVLETYGNTVANGTGLDSAHPMSGLLSGNTGEPGSPTTANVIQPITFRGRAQPMPRVPCSYPGSQVPTSGDAEFTAGAIPRTYVACILMPPNKSGNVLYFRMIIRWTVEFSDLVSMIEKESAGTIINGSNQVYNRTYEFTAGSKISDVVDDDQKTVDTNSLETLNGDVNLVMEK